MQGLLWENFEEKGALNWLIGKVMSRFLEDGGLRVVI